MVTMALVQRMKPNDVDATVSVIKEIRLTMSERAFLGNASNKQALIYLLADEMVRSEIHVKNASLEAVFKICQMHTIRSPVAAVAEDSDLFKLLVHHADPGATNLYVAAANGTVSATIIKRRVDVQLSKSLLFLHAISGYNRTSRPHGIGKVGVLKKYATLAESTATFMARETSKVSLEKDQIDRAAQSDILTRSNKDCNKHILVKQ